MEDNQYIGTNSSVSTDTSPHPSTYELLIRQSKKLGNVAMKAGSELRHILHHQDQQKEEAKTPEREHWLVAFKRKASELSGEEPKKKKELDQAAQLKEVVKKSHETLASARTVFPITLFPDSIVVDRTKISITKRDFFWTSNVISFRIEDVLNVSCAIGPLFGSLTIASRVMSSIDHFQINYLWRSDAVFLKHLIQGHIIAINNHLETDKLDKKELIDTLCELGIDSG